MRHLPVYVCRSAALVVAGLFVAVAGCATDGGTASRTGRTKSTTQPTTAATASVPIDPTIARIREEGLERSRVMQTADYLCDVIGPRLTGTSRLRTANDWTRDELSRWGLTNAHLEEWGPFGTEWSIKRYSLQIVEPFQFNVIGYPRAWSPGFDAPKTADVVFLDATRESDLDQYKGKLAGKFVLIGQPRAVEPRFQPLAERHEDDHLAQMAKLELGQTARDMPAKAETPAERRARFMASNGANEALLGGRRTTASAPTATPVNQPTTRPASQPTTRGTDTFAARLLGFAADENAALALFPSTTGDGGTFFVTSVAVPNEPPRVPGVPNIGPRYYSANASKNIPQVTLAVEDYNRLVRGSRLGVAFKAQADLQVRFSEDEKPAYDTIAEIPGSDLKDQIVMIGAHLDSWHSAQGATDNCAGSATVMEAVRILSALNLHPRRTIRVGLWTGEEQGLLGSAAYVKKHFAYREPAATKPAASRPATLFADPATEPEGGIDKTHVATSAQAGRPLIKLDEYEKLSVYFNLDNGTGRIRGIYAQGNAAAAPYFQKWLQPFADLGASTVTLSNTGGTDHLSFDGVGLPGFQFIQDPMEYFSRTHHSNEDVYDRLQAEDLKQASTIMAAFLLDAANMDERFPRKPFADGQP